MGVCLVEHALTRGISVAVNPAYVEDVVSQNGLKAKKAVCLLDIGVDLKGFRPFVMGAQESVLDLLRQAAQVGVQQISLRSIGGENKLRPSNFLMNRSDRIVLVREMFPDEFTGDPDSFTTASEMFLEDGSTRMIVERPGIFVGKANENGRLMGL